MERKPRRVVDVHTHVLPGIDDGAPSLDEARAMVEYAKDKGVEMLLTTPHCYVKNAREVTDFLAQRDAAFSALSEHSALPLVRGAEVRMEKMLPDIENIKSLCIENTDYMLLEMPPSRWDEGLIESVYALTLLGIKPVMAHIERFCEQRIFPMLLELPLYYQITADTVYTHYEKPVVKRLITLGFAQLIGSDTHNNTARPNTTADAIAHIEKKMGRRAADAFCDNAHCLIENKPLLRNIPFEKKGFFGTVAL